MSTERKRDLYGLVKMLIIALIACTTVHKLGGCARGPAYSVGVVAGVASERDLLPKTGDYSGTPATVHIEPEAAESDPEAP